MSESLNRTGGCLCGAVKFEVRLQETDVHICHCDLCKKWSGGPSFSLSCEEAATVTGEENLTWFNSSEWGQRAFCNKCGTHLFGCVTEGGYHGVHVGNLDNQEGLKIGVHIFIDKKPPYYDFADGAKRLTGAEFFAMFEESA